MSVRLHTTWRHKRRGGLYTVLLYAVLQEAGSTNDGAVCVVYRGEDGTLWVRPEAEFADGRFEEVP